MATRRQLDFYKELDHSGRHFYIFAGVYLLFIILSVAFPDAYPDAIHRFGYNNLPLISTPTEYLVVNGDERRATKVSAAYISTWIGFVALLGYVLYVGGYLFKHINWDTVLKDSEKPKSMGQLFGGVLFIILLIFTAIFFIGLFLYDGNYYSDKPMSFMNRVHEQDFYLFFPALIAIVICGVFTCAIMIAIRVIAFFQLNDKRGAYAARKTVE